MSAHYRITVVIAPRLSAANKRSLKRNVALWGLHHTKLHKARAAASALSMLPTARRVELDRVEVRRVYTYNKGIRVNDH